MSGRHCWHVGDRQKWVSWGGCSWQTQILTLPSKLVGDPILVLKLSVGNRRSLRDLSPFTLVVLKVIWCWDTHVSEETETEWRGQNELLEVALLCALEESAHWGSWPFQWEQNLAFLGLLLVEHSSSTGKTFCLCNRQLTWAKCFDWSYWLWWKKKGVSRVDIDLLRKLWWLLMIISGGFLLNEWNETCVHCVGFYTIP